MDYFGCSCWKQRNRIFQRDPEIYSALNHRQLFSKLEIFSPSSSMSKPGEESTDVDKKEKTRKVRTAYDVQRAKLEKLMKDPSKPVYIPTTRTEKDPNKAPDFVYNVRCLLKNFLRNNHISNWLLSAINVLG